MVITTRAATKADTDFARRIHHHAYREVVERQFGVWNEDRQNEFFETSWSSGKSSCRMLVCDGISCGYVMIDHLDDCIHLRELVVAPDFQHRGIGTHVLQETMNLARARGVAVRLSALNENRALGLYSKLGFKESARTETHTLMEWYYS
jgi:ribosomal protein S18 acetylase RimI-like enzyme